MLYRSNFDKHFSKVVTARKLFIRLIFCLCVVGVLMILRTSYHWIAVGDVDDRLMDKILRTDLKTCAKNCFPRMNIDESFPKFPCLTGIPPSVNRTSLVIVVASQAHLKHERDLTRAIWTRRRAYDIDVKFVLGKTRLTTSRRESLLREMNDNNDIIVGDFDDTYRNLTLKTIFAIRWVVANCRRAKYVMKTDHDVAVNIDNLMTMLALDAPSGIVGDCFGPFAPIRRPDDKWYTPMSEYSLSYFPKYCSGIGYVVSMNAARALVRLSPVVRPLAMEDVYVGLLLSKLGVEKRRVRGFDRVRSWAPQSDEYFCDCVIAGHEYTFSERETNGRAVLGKRCVMRGRFHCFLLILRARYVLTCLAIIASFILIRCLVVFMRFAIYRYFKR
ncbi:beta-1,3-galactosyltransferase 1-like [Tubulanus polymorphus]|uniref:beta-1,3-galactosyltransferase 1-like n=1 Tax=Tubulanus polymorphus TaxID=672921 RepID=UPI003DA22703